MRPRGAYGTRRARAGAGCPVWTRTARARDIECVLCMPVRARDARDTRDDVWLTIAYSRTRIIRCRSSLFALINGVPTVYETLSAADGKGAGAGKSGGKNGGSDVGAGGNGAKGAGKGGAKRQKPDPVRLRACSTMILARDVSTRVVSLDVNQLHTDPCIHSRFARTQTDAQGFKKPSTGFILQVDEPLDALKNAQIEVRRRHSSEPSFVWVFSIH